MQTALDALWRWTGELTASETVSPILLTSGVAIDPGALATPWRTTLADVLAEATLVLPAGPATETGGRRGQHTAHLATLLSEMQSLPRAMPGATW
jgi:ring-1,2-phenylacetyl-CoA epoxidase subunit PaaC